MLLLESVKRLAAVMVLGMIGFTTVNILASNPLIQNAGFCAPATPGSDGAC